MNFRMVHDYINDFQIIHNGFCELDQPFNEKIYFLKNIISSQDAISLASLCRAFWWAEVWLEGLMSVQIYSDTDLLSLQQDTYQWY